MPRSDVTDQSNRRLTAYRKVERKDRQAVSEVKAKPYGFCLRCGTEASLSRQRGRLTDANRSVLGRSLDFGSVPAQGATMQFMERRGRKCFPHLP